MAHEGKFATSSEILTKAGTNYNSTFVSEAKINELCLQAESRINITTRYNWTDHWTAGTLNVDVKYILTEAESCWVAMQIIAADMSGYSSRVEAETMLDLLNARFNECITILRDQENRQWIVEA
jgi:hypothetical protein